MKLNTLRIRNFRCFKRIEFDIDSMHAIVGSNGAGKSTVLHALDFVFNPSTKKINDESFYQKNTDLRIEVEALFVDLSESERAAFDGYLRPDDSFHMMRTAQSIIEEGEGSTPDNDYETKIKVSQHFCKPQPELDWLNPSKISGDAMKEWWTNKDSLVHNGTSFAELLGSKKPSVGDWIEKAAQFAKEHLKENDYANEWQDNPKGYPGVLKGNLPHYELIPAVRDATDESKVTKTSPFGRLIYEILETLDEGLRDEVAAALKAATFKLNREAKDERATKVAEIESTIQGFLAEMMPADLELEFQAPTVEVILTTPKVYVDDGFRGGIDGKGHGLQRAVIFSILRAYAQLVTRREGKPKRTLILGVEEPELYMHPTAQRTIRRVLREIADGGDQVLFSTHSPLMVDVSYFDEIIRIEAPELVKGRVPPGGNPTRHQLPVKALIEDLVVRHHTVKDKVTAESIRERYSHAYTASRNEGFFANRIILVEGQTEVYSLPIYAAAMDKDLDSLGVAVVECGGKNQVDRLYRVFNELGIVCYPVFDYDKGNAKESNQEANEHLLALFNATDIKDPDKAEVRDQFACFAVNWETDLSSEIEDYDNLVADARKSLGLRDDSGKPLIARYIAEKQTQQNPPAVPTTVKSIIKKALAAKHSGTCLKGKNAKE